MVLNQQVNNDDANPLCCCEYENERGERSHLLAFCCDCAELDEAVDRLISRKEMPNNAFQQIYGVLEDRFRIPWPGGAIKIRPSSLFASILVPASLMASQYNMLAFGISHGFVFLFFYIFFRKVLRFRPRDKFFLSWTNATTTFLFLIYQIEIIGILRLPRIISPWENLCLVTFLVLTVLSGRAVQKGQLAAFPKTYDYDKVLPRKKIGRSGAAARTPSATYCRICDAYVQDKDHHCVWIDSCISSSNFGSFVLFLFFLSITLIQSVLIELSSICIASRPALFNLVLVPTNCRAFNPKFLGNPHLVFACALHSAFIALPVALMFFFKLWQLVRMWAKQNVQRRPSV